MLRRFGVILELLLFMHCCVGNFVVACVECVLISFVYFSIFAINT